MLSLSTADGFMSVKEGVDDMIQYIANEPSVGLYFVQQHAQVSMPYLLDVKEEVVEKIHDVSLHTEDVEDSIDILRSMTEFGYPLAEEMIKDINTSLLVISKHQPNRGLIQNTAWGRVHQTDINSSNAAVVTFGSTNNSGHQGDEGSRDYFSTVLRSAKRRAAGFRRPLIHQPSTIDQLGHFSPQSSDASASFDAETEELPLSCSLQIAETMMEPLDNKDSHDCKILYPLQDYSKFNNDKEANYEAWLQESEEQYKFLIPGD